MTYEKSIIWIVGSIGGLLASAAKEEYSVPIIVASYITYLIITWVIDMLEDK